MWGGEDCPTQPLDNPRGRCVTSGTLVDCALNVLRASKHHGIRAGISKLRRTAQHKTVLPPRIAPASQASGMGKPIPLILSR
jgi:hypothetical protein